jgi:hypothetical protein
MSLPTIKEPSLLRLSQTCCCRPLGRGLSMLLSLLLPLYVEPNSEGSGFELRSVLLLVASHFYTLYDIFSYIVYNNLYVYMYWYRQV